MKKIIILLATLVLATTLYGAEGPIKCKEDGTQLEMNKCAHDDFLKADKELNQVYKALRKVKKEDKLFLKNLKKAQRAWLAYRDADLDAQFTCEGGDLRSCFGSMYGLLLNGSKAELTLQRVKILKEQLSEANL
ncbi:MAG: Unknown protein [uncultured Sulfurovum sp.]|uniref:Lysozyme inhibitor LprI-like N-terminal domain-containing protein n=1 Tax=uncultured Sulfurovum sp. TaxID=269237 RepID=A0A6S6TFB5_9BACT|nr:MAG: Unknown protein [uncultured Sulfurovum sp.]